MSEWPKTLEEDMGTYKNYYEVVPADLGRELYEAAKDAPWCIKSDAQYGACEGPEDLGKGVRVVRRLEDAIVRYEREVSQ